MMEVVRKTHKSDKFIIGDTEGYHAYVTFIEGEIAQVSLYEGRKQLVIGLHDRGFRVLRDVLVKSIRIIDGYKEGEDGTS